MRDWMKEGFDYLKEIQDQLWPDVKDCEILLLDDLGEAEVTVRILIPPYGVCHFLAHPALYELYKQDSDIQGVIVTMLEKHDVVFNDGGAEIKSVFLGNQGGTTIDNFVEVIKIANRLGLTGRAIVEIQVHKGKTFTAELYHQKHQPGSPSKSLRDQPAPFEPSHDDAQPLEP